MTRRRNAVALLAASVIVSFVAAEAGMRRFGYFNPPPPEPVPRFPYLYQADPELGYTLKPSTRLVYEYPVGSSRMVTVISNSHGFRSSREFDEPDARPRIWVLGDSMVLGEGVDADQRFTEVLEQLEPGWRVDNLGMTGWGLDLMVRAFERVSRHVRPDVLLVAFYTDDFRRLQPYYAGMGYPFPKFELAQGRLITVPFPDVPWWKRVRLVQAVEQSLWRLGRNRFRLNEALLDRLRAASQEGFTLAVAFLPGRLDVAEDQMRRTWLREWCERTRTPFVDLTEPIHSAGSNGVHLRGNPHWNEKGHRVAAESIRRFLRESAMPRMVPNGELKASPKGRAGETIRAAIQKAVATGQGPSIR
jgi:hypothetical protein